MSMTDFILNVDRNKPKAKSLLSITDIHEYKRNVYDEILNYANFIKQPLLLSMFVPCDEDDNPIQKPKEHIDNRSLYYKELEQYQKALDRVLFEEFEIQDYEKHKILDHEETVFLTSKDIDDGDCIAHRHKSNKYFYYNYETIESLTLFYTEINLTDSAIKQIGLWHTMNT